MAMGDRLYVDGQMYEKEMSTAGIMEHKCEDCSLNADYVCQKVVCEDYIIKKVPMERKKVYISGQITGIEMKDCIARFENAEREVRNMGFEPVNPLDNGLTEFACYGDHIRASLKMMLECDMIYMLRGWEHSNGARMEHEVACKCGMEILKYE